MDLFMKALKELQDAQAELKESQKAASAARSTEISALNRLNLAQKAVDKLVDELKSASPRESDWGSRK